MKLGTAVLFSALSPAAFLPEPARIADDVGCLPNADAEQEANGQNQHIAGSYHGRPAFCAKCTTAQISAAVIVPRMANSAASSRGVE